MHVTSFIYYMTYNTNFHCFFQLCDSHKRPVWFLFSGMGSQWLGMGRDLLQVEIFRATIEQCDKVLAPMNVSLRTLFENPTEEMFRNPIHVMTGVIGMQVNVQ